MSKAASEAAIDRVLSFSREADIEGVIVSTMSGLTRFADSAIHQNVYEENSLLMVRVAIGDRVAGARTNVLTASAVDETVRKAIHIAKATPPDPAFPGFAEPQPPLRANGRFVEATAQATPVDRARRVRTFVEATRGLRAAGALETESREIILGNSRGVRAVGRFTGASFVAVVDGGDATGYVEGFDGDLGALSMEDLGRRAVQKVAAGRAPRPLPPGSYTVILEPAAVGLMLNYLGYYTFNGKAVHEGRSYLAGKLGQSIADSRLSVWDDATDPRTIGIPFDFEGVPKRKVVLIDRGVAQTPVYDRRTAKLAGTATTGHALPQPNAYGPVPTNLFLSTGTTSFDEMLASTDRGVLVTRFHYVRVVDPLRTIITGMTRDGTFLIEGGKIASGVKNLRFNQSIIDTLASVEAIGAQGRLSSESYIGAAWVPPLKVRAFNFSSATTF
jgi:predicted Zn-dependent protease